VVISAECAMGRWTTHPPGWFLRDFDPQELWLWTGVGASGEKHPNIKVDPFGPWPRMVACALA
jgi:hypothetical protein